MIGEENTSNIESEKAYARSARMHDIIDDSLGGDGWRAEDGKNVELGRNILREEIGYFGPWEGANYKLDEATRDRLLAHTREDTASSFAMARSAFREAHFALKAAQTAKRLTLVVLLLNCVILGTLLWVQL